MERVAMREGLDQSKPPDEERIFIFGASSVIGYHHLGLSSLSDALQFGLQRTAPTRRWKIANFGKAGESSEFVLANAEASLLYHPDLIIVYVGENEFIPPAIIRRQMRYRLERFLLRSKWVRLARVAWGQSPDPSMPDFHQYSYQQLVEAIAANRGAVLNDFQKRLRSLDQRVNQKLTILIVGPVPNMLWAPSFYEDFDALNYNKADPATRVYFKGVLLQEKGHFAAAERRFQAVLRLHPEFADAHYRLGICRIALGRGLESIPALKRAIETDPIPNRPLQATYDILRKEAKNSLFIDTKEAIRGDEPNPWIGWEWIEDNCHPTLHFEWELAKWILVKPGIRDRLRLAHARVDFPPLDEYLRERRIDSQAEARMDARIALYHDGRPSAEPWLRQALLRAPSDPDVQEAEKQYQTRSRERETRRRAALQRIQRALEPSL